MPRQISTNLPISRDARIYNPESYGNNFHSHQSRGFNPVSAIDRSNQEKQKAQQQLDNLRRDRTSSAVINNSKALH